MHSRLVQAWRPCVTIMRNILAFGLYSVKTASWRTHIDTLDRITINKVIETIQSIYLLYLTFRDVIPTSSELSLLDCYKWTILRLCYTVVINNLLPTSKTPCVTQNCRPIAIHFYQENKRNYCRRTVNYPSISNTISTVHVPCKSKTYAARPTCRPPWAQLNQHINIKSIDCILSVLYVACTKDTILRLVRLW